MCINALLLLTIGSQLITNANAQEGTLVIEGFEEAPEEVTSTLPNEYVIQEGDTLWDISNKFMGDSDSWPELWSLNEKITNPHWIYPGNKIVFVLGTDTNPPEMQVEDDSRDGYQPKEIVYESTQSQCGPDIRFDKAYPESKYTVAGFIENPKELDVFGKVVASPSNQAFLVEKNLIYLKLDNIDNFECGDKISLFRRIKKNVRHPQSFFKKYGSLYQISGEAKVLHKYGNYVTAEVLTSYAAVSRGDLVGPVRKVRIQVPVAVPKGDLQGTVIERLALMQSASIDQNTVFIDRGSNDGVKEGDSFYLIEQGDTYSPKKRLDATLPPYVIGRITIVSVDDGSATGVITDASRAINVGTKVSMKLD